MSGSPMDPKRLALVRSHIEHKFRARGTAPLMCELLDDRDHREAEAREWEAMCDAEAQRFRSRCPVTAEDVEAAGVTAVHARAWLDSTEVDEDLAAHWYDDLTQGEVADLCNEAHENWETGKLAMAILDEMAKGAAR